MGTNDESDNKYEHNMVKNPSCKEADQLAIYNHDQGSELGPTKKQLQLSGQSPSTPLCLLKHLIATYSQ